MMLYLRKGAVQALMAASYLLSNYVDKYVAASQRATMGLCVKCGGLEEGSCDECSASPDQASVR